MTQIGTKRPLYKPGDYSKLCSFGYDVLDFQLLGGAVRMLQAQFHQSHWLHQIDMAIHRDAVEVWRIAHPEKARWQCIR